MMTNKENLCLTYQNYLCLKSKINLIIIIIKQDKLINCYFFSHFINENNYKQ